MYQKIISERAKDFSAAIENFKKEAGKIRTGRVNPAIFENLMVDYYGNKTPLKQMASISVPEARLVVIQPWSVDSLANIEAAIKLSEMNLNPNNDGRVIRISIPPLTEERRGELVKMLNKKSEEARISIRIIRDEIWNEIKELEKDGKLSEDDKYRAKERFEEAVEKYNKQIEELRGKKEKEIMTV